MEKVGGAMGVVSSRIENDLKRFKEFIESRGQETGAWRGEIAGQNIDLGRSRTQTAESEPRSKRVHSEKTKM